MTVEKKYMEKCISLSEAVALVQSNQTIGVGIAGSEPVGLLTTMADRALDVENVHFWTCLPMRPYDIFTKASIGGCRRCRN